MPRDGVARRRRPASRLDNGSSVVNRSIRAGEIFSHDARKSIIGLKPHGIAKSSA
jgi:hypothetical protein